MKDVLRDCPVGRRHRHEKEEGGPDGKEQDQPKRDRPGALASGGMRGNQSQTVFDFKDIADASDGMNHLRREGIIDLGPQTSHHDIDDISAGIEINVPHLFHDFGP